MLINGFLIVGSRTRVIYLLGRPGPREYWHEGASFGTDYSIYRLHMNPVARHVAYMGIQ